MKALHKITFILLVIGGLNWLLEVFGWGVGNFIPSGVANIVYLLIGISAILELIGHKKNCANCSAGRSSAPTTPSMPSQMPPR